MTEKKVDSVNPKTDTPKSMISKGDVEFVKDSVGVLWEVSDKITVNQEQEDGSTKEITIGLVDSFDQPVISMGCPMVNVYIAHPKTKEILSIRTFFNIKEVGYKAEKINQNEPKEV